MTDLDDVWTYTARSYETVDQVWHLGYRMDFAPINLGPGDSIKFTYFEWVERAKD